MQESEERTVSSQLAEEIVRRLVDALHPERIILFGSAARGEMRTVSDVDLLVVKAGMERREAARIARCALRRLGVAKDVVVVTPEDVARHGRNRGLVIHAALRDGRVLYAA